MHDTSAAWVLHYGKPAALLDGPEPPGAVGVPAGQHDADQRIAERIRRAFEQEIDGGPGEVNLIIDGQAEAPVRLDEQMYIPAVQYTPCQDGAFLVFRLLDFFSISLRRFKCSAR